MTHMMRLQEANPAIVYSSRITSLIIKIYFALVTHNISESQKV